MEGYSRKDTEWLMKKMAEEKNHEEKKLELRLGPPGGGDWTSSRDHENKNLLSFGYNTWLENNHHQVSKSGGASSFLNLHQSSHHVMKEKELQQQQQQQSGAAEKKTAVPNNSAQKRTAPGPVVGWPPIRSFRKNLASGGSSKSTSESTDVATNKAPPPKPVENCPKGLFVKINMDGIPIGRKVDLKAYDSYEKLANAVDELFRGLLAAQSDSTSANGTKDKELGGKVIGGLLDGSGEYTLVYEDNEGDRMLVGDVPWHMFISTVKRLRVLKSSELPMLSNGGKQGKISR